MKDPMVILQAARLAAGLTYKQWAEALALPPEVCKYPEDCLQHVNTLQGILGMTFGPLEEWVVGLVPPSSVAEDHLSQKWCSHGIHAARAVRLERVLTLRDRVRYSLQQMPGTTTWLSVTPNEGLGIKLEGRDYRTLKKWWLVKPLVTHTAECARAVKDR